MARPTSSRSDATIAEGTQIRGRVSGEGTLHVAGSIEGDVVLRGDLFVAAGGTLKSNVEAADVTVEGSLEGAVSAGGGVTVAAGARLLGDVQAARFTLEEGGEFAGQLAHDFELPTVLSDPLDDTNRGAQPSTSSRRR